MQIGEYVQRWRWWIVAAWAAACGALFVFVPSGDPAANERTSFLPPTTAFRKAMDLQGQAFPTRGGLSQAVLVIERPGGILSVGPDGDRAFIEKLARELRLPREGGLTPQQAASISVRSPGLLDVAFETALLIDAPQESIRWLLQHKILHPGKTTPPQPLETLLPPNPMRSPHTQAGQAAVIRVNIPADFITLRSTKIVRQLRDLVGATSGEGGLPTANGPLRKPPGLRIAVTGTGGYGHDYAEFIRQSHAQTMQATLIAVIVILLLVYRAPLAALVPLAAVGLAAAIVVKLMNVAQGMGVSIGLAEQIFVFVLMFGAGIDYSLLLISRTREFLAEGLDPDRAVARAINTTTPAIAASAATDAVVAHFGAAGLEAALRPYLGQSPSLVTAFASMIRHESPAPSQEAPTLTALHSLYTQLQHGLADERPVLWIVEDLHFADSIGLQLALSLARGAEGRRVLMVLTGRPGLPQEELSHLGRLASFQRIRLARLSVTDVVALLRASLRSEVLAERLAPSIHKKSDGVPFFVFELLRGLKEGRYLSETDDGSFVESKSIRDIEVPETVKDLIGARMSDLDIDHRSLLEAAAVQGFIFDADVLAAIVDQPLVRVLQTLAHIERGTAVIKAEGRQYRFDHHQLQEVVYGGIHPRLREEYHTLVAGAFLAGAPEGSAASGEVAYRIADHHLRGSRPAEGIDFVLPALKHLGRTYRHEAAAALTERALEVDGVERFEILMSRVESLHELGRREEEREALAQAEALSGPGSCGRVLQAIGRCSLRTSEIDRARECFEEALALARAGGDREAEADTLGQIGTVLAHRGLFAEALALYETRIAICNELGDRRREAAAADSIGEALSGLGRNDEALVWAKRAVELSRELGSKRMLASATGNLASLLRSTGDLDSALTLGRQYIELNREIGYREGIAIGTGNLARTQSAVGNIGKAAEQFRRAAALCRELGNRMSEGMYLGILGTLLLEIGDFDGARKNLEVARELFEKIGDRRLVGYCIRELGEVAAETGDAALAGRLFDQAQTEFEAQPFPPGEAGLARARAEGKHLGRPGLSAETVSMIKKLRKTKSVRIVARELGLSPSVVGKYS